MHRKSFTLLIILFLSSVGIARDRKDARLVHGTINVMLANRNGAVVLTDSMLTSGTRQLSQPGQKLFRIDDHTVCTVAGLIYANVHALGNAEVDLAANTAATIQDFATQYRSYSLNLGMEDRLQLLATFLRVHVSILSSARKYSGEGTPSDNYEIQAMLIGYDRDGILKVGRVVLKTVPQKDYLSSEIVSTRWQEVKDELIWEVSGVDAVARPSLENPQIELREGGLREFATSISADRGKGLTLDQLRTVAQTLADRTSAKYPGVGGKYQIAVLKNGKIENFEQEPFPAVAPITHLSLTVGSTLPKNAFVTNEAMVYLGNRFVADERTIDNNYFIGNEFSEYTLNYNGGPFVFDKSNKLVHTVLRLGPKVDMNNKAVRQLVTNFSWARVEYPKTRTHARRPRTR